MRRHFNWIESMPIAKIFFDKSLTDKVRKHHADLQNGLEHMMVDQLKTRPELCQVIMVPSLYVSRLPVFVDLQFREADHRNRQVVDDCLKVIARLINNHLGSGVRIRAFDLNQSRLHALDVEAP